QPPQRWPKPLLVFGPRLLRPGKRGADSLTMPKRYGPERRRLLRCHTYKVRFAQCKVTPLFETRSIQRRMDGARYFSGKDMMASRSAPLAGVIPILFLFIPQKAFISPVLSISTGMPPN